MSSFLRNLTISFNARENAIKENLISTLNENAKEIQFECKEQDSDSMGLNECTSSLCSTLEAFFLHGLKDSFLWQTINVISGTDVDRRPEPSYWSPLLVFLHKQTIEQIQGLSQINSEVGNCRAWIRLSLNDALISSYLNNIRKNNSALNPYYKKCAILKDIDTLEIAAKILEGIEAAVQINLPANSTLLNRWSDLPLQMSGIWTPPLRSCAIASGVDVASSLSDETAPIPTPQPLHCNELFPESISNSPFNQSAFRATEDLTEKEHFQIFLTKFDEIQENADTESDKPDNDTVPQEGGSHAQEASVETSQDSDRAIGGNSLALKTSWAGCDQETSTKNIAAESLTIASDSTSQFSRSNSMTQSINSLKSPVDYHSYNALLRKHRKTRELDWNDVWERFESSIGITGNDSGVVVSSTSNLNTSNSDESEEDAVNGNSTGDFGFEILPQSLSEKFTTAELQEMVEQACKLAHEPGLNTQGFICKSCAHPLGIGFAIAQVCAFSGHYYCGKCMSVEQFTIPARVIYNWDFRKYSVSKKAAAFMTEFQCQPFIDLKILNPKIYNACDEMATLQSLRIRLNFIRAYLFTCCQPIIDELQKQVWSREYLYEYIHSYSMADLAMIQRGTLAQLLQKTVTFGEQHIINCPLCSVKGFICEICNGPKVLYPFHLDTTFRCQICGAVFHDQCLNDSQPCPKCERRRKREDLPLFEAVHML